MLRGTTWQALAQGSALFPPRVKRCQHASQMCTLSHTCLGVFLELSTVLASGILQETGIGRLVDIHQDL